MKLFPPKSRTTTSETAPGQAEKSAATLAEIAERLDKLQCVITDLKQNIDLIPSIVRKLYLEGMDLEPPYDLMAQRFGYLSQNEEDGLLLAIFNRVGVKSRRFVEIGCGMNGGNSGFLAQELGWRGLMVDALAASIEKVTVRYTGHAVTAVQERVTREGINALIDTHGFAGDVDLLSIDIDGNDYWVWQAISACHPRVVAIEYNWLLGGTRAVTVPYDPEFDLSTIPVRGFRGASLAALVHLGKEKGYRLVATERVNAFFLRDDIAPDIKAVSCAQGYRAPLNINRCHDIFQKFEGAGLTLVTVAEPAAGV